MVGERDKNHGVFTIPCKIPVSDWITQALYIPRAGLHLSAALLMVNTSVIADSERSCHRVVPLTGVNIRMAVSRNSELMLKSLHGSTHVVIELTKWLFYMRIVFLSLFGRNPLDFKTNALEL